MHLPIVTILPKDTNSQIRVYQDTFIKTKRLFIWDRSFSQNSYENTLYKFWQEK